MDLVAFWKAASIGLTAAFGIVGLIFDFKDKNTGRVTKAGYAVLCGTVLSAGFGIAVQVAEQSAQERDRAETASQTLQIAKSTNEAVKGIKGLISKIENPTMFLRFKVICEKDMLKFCEAVKKNQNKIDPKSIRTVWSAWPDQPPTEAFHLEVYPNIEETRKRL